MTDPDFRDPNVDRAYRETPRDEPPSELDERIRAAARRAVGTRPQSLEQQAADEKRRRSWASRWRVPLSVAATIVIATTLTVMVQDEERRPRDDAGRDAAPMIVAPREAERPAPASTPEAAARSVAPAQAPAAPPPAPRSPEPDAAAARVPDPPDRAKAPRPPASNQKREEPTLEVQQPAAGEPAPVAPGQLEMRRQTPQPAAAPPLAAPAPSPASPSAAKPARQMAPAGAASESLRRDRALGDRPERASRDASAIRTPEAWIDHIRSLRAQGREAEATAELAEFRRAYPDFQLPTDLAR
ncbi:MAG: hypothetical protein ABWZ41_04250 [Burkholderiales bacterium]